jgi:hypothetical protein
MDASVLKMNDVNYIYVVNSRYITAYDPIRATEEFPSII